MDRNTITNSTERYPKKSLSARRAWIEILLGMSSNWMYQSLSARRAWIEIVIFRFPPLQIPVALRKESVDRNSFWFSLFSCPALVALRKESVDRNCAFIYRAISRFVSLSARRAWIEMNLLAK